MINFPCALESRTPLFLALEKIKHGQRQCYGWLPLCLDFFKEEILGCSQLDLKLICKSMHPSTGLDAIFLKCMFFKTNTPNITKDNNQRWFFMRGTFHRASVVDAFSCGCLTIEACSQHFSNSDFGSRGWGNFTMEHDESTFTVVSMF